MFTPRLGTAAILALVFAACLPAPKKDYTPADIAKIDELAEVMRVQAQYADPQFGKREQQAFTDAELADMKKTSEMLQATAERIKGFKGQGAFDDGFADFATQLGGHAKSLGTAADDKDAAAVRDALTKMKDTCSGCHGVYR